MVSVRQRSTDFFVRYAIVDADRQGVTGPLDLVLEIVMFLCIRFFENIHSSLNDKFSDSLYMPVGPRGCRRHRPTHEIR